MAGRFISFEGGEGCGKSTQIRLLAERLEAAGHEVLCLREPGGTELGEAIRNLLQHDAAGHGMTPESEILLFAASRAQLTRERIRPALEAGTIVLCDRFLDSTTVYQGVARALDPEAVASINAFAVGETMPDMTILLDLDPEVGLERITSRGTGELDRMESETLEFFEAVREGYTKLAATHPDRFVTINADQPEQTIAEETWNAVEQRIA